jgi:hypothetical protein
VIDLELQRRTWLHELIARERERYDVPELLAAMASIPRDVSMFTLTRRERVEAGL